MNNKLNLFLGEKIHFVKRHLGIMSSFNPQEERQQAREFVLHYLKDDGVFLTRLLSLNSSDLVVTELINQLWIRYKNASRLYSTVNPQRHIPTSQITNNENTSNTNHPNGTTSLNRPRTSRIPPPPLPTFHQYTKNEKSETKSAKDTDV
jgi:hypothetical protein